MLGVRVRSGKATRCFKPEPKLFTIHQLLLSPLVTCFLSPRFEVADSHFKTKQSQMMTEDLTAVQGTSELSLRDSSIQKRLCWVCFGTEQDDEGTNVVWICPCKCKGSMKWVHEECLQRWIDEKQKRANSPRVSCSQCKTHYILSFPPVNCLVRLIENYDRMLYNSSPYFAVSVFVGSIYWCCGSYGFISIIQVMGYEEGRRMIDESDPLLLVIGLPVIPITLILAKLIKWEDFILRLWRQSTLKLPRPLSYFIEGPPVQPRANCDQILLDPGFNEPLACTRMIGGALLLPTVSALVGKLFFSKFSGSQWRRSLIGGLAFLLIKGALKIYLRKSQYVRYSQRAINDYVPNTKSSQTSGGRSIMEGPDSTRDDTDLQPTSNNDHHRDDLFVQDESDEELTTTRTLFSMTIRL